MDFWKMIKEQGLLFALMIGIVAYLIYDKHTTNKQHFADVERTNAQMQLLNDKIDECNGEKFSLLLDISQKSTRAVIRNNELLEEIIKN